jgi:hypothetical protein
MTRYPLLLGFRDLIAGNGFVASVALNGRALLVDEGDGFWMYGVNPTVSEWEEAVTEVRTGRIDADWLPKRRAETRLYVEVTKLDHPVPSENVPDETELAA